MDEEQVGTREDYSEQLLVRKRGKSREHKIDEVVGNRDGISEKSKLEDAEDLNASGEDEKEGIRDSEGFESPKEEQAEENAVFYDKAEGSESSSVTESGDSGDKAAMNSVLEEYSTESGDSGSTPSAGVLKFSATVTNDVHQGASGKDVPDPSQDPSSEINEGLKFPTEIIGEEDDLVNESDVAEETEYDVETVIHKQRTHDLFCPNCKSCITRRVILRRRKRGVQISDREPKRNKTEATDDAKAATPSQGDQVHEENGGSLNHAQEPARDDEHEGADVFRCLACFTLFRPNGQVFKFKLFGDRSGRETVKEKQVTNIQEHWFISSFTSNKHGKASEKGKESTDSTVKTDTTLSVGEPGKNTIFVPHPGESKVLSPSNEGSLNFSKSEDLQRPSQEGLSRGDVYSSELSRDIVPESKIDVDTSYSLKTSSVSVDKVTTLSQGKDSVIIIEEKVSQSTSLQEGTPFPTQTTDPLQSSAQFSTARQETIEIRRELGIEVIKSIVYGGLAESITSLSVVSSAAGGNAETLNVLALGAANLIGGLLVFFHNIWELKHDQTDHTFPQASSQAYNARDRYSELLGSRRNFIIHMVVAILSYFIFGLVPPVVYGFSFQKSDDKDLKLLVMESASLLCILVLSIAHAYVKRPPKPYLKSIATFIILGFAASGMGYGAGKLFERLLQNLGLFQKEQVPGLFLPEMVSTGPAWVSY